MEYLKGVKLLRKEGKPVPAEEVLKNKKVIVFFFSAAWCGPCKVLLPLIKRMYEENLKRNSRLEIIYVSSDLDEEIFMDHFTHKQGNWYAVPYDHPASEELRIQFGINNIPNLVVIRQDGSIVTTRGRKDIEDIGINVLITWTE